MAYQNEDRRFANYRNQAQTQQRRTNTASHGSAVGSSNRGYADYIRERAGATGTDVQNWLPSNEHKPDVGVANQFMLQNGLRPWQVTNNPQGGLPPAPPAPTGGGGGRGYSGGGGQRGPDLGNIAGLMQSGLMELFGSSLFRPEQMEFTPEQFDGSSFQALRGRANEGAEADRGAKNSAYDSLVSALQANHSNPFTAPQARAQAPNAVGMDMLRAQGVDGSSAALAAEESSGAAADADRQFANMMGMQAANAERSQQSRLSEAEQARAFAGQSIDAQLRGLLTGVDLRENDSRTRHSERQDERRWATEQSNMQRREQSREQMLQSIMPVLQLLAEAGLPMASLAEWGIQ